jgi:hypothetical protein
MSDSGRRTSQEGDEQHRLLRERQPGRGCEGDCSVDAALQLSSGTLLALQASLASITNLRCEHAHAEASLVTAIDLVRTAIADLREVGGSGERSPRAFGFVCRPGGCDESI